MDRRSQDREASSKDFARETHLSGQLRIGKRGVYLVRGDEKLRSLQLIPWDRILAVLENSAAHET